MSDQVKSEPVTSPPIRPMAAEPAAPAPAAPLEIAFDIQDLCIYYGTHQAIKNVTMQIPAGSVTAIIGPSGCGKSTALRSLNRMHELTPGARHTGKILMKGQDLYAPGVDATLVRRRVGMIFQKSNPFPTLTIAENVLVGLRLNGIRDKSFLNQRLEESLRMAALWVKRSKISSIARERGCPAGSSSACASRARWRCGRKSS